MLNFRRLRGKFQQNGAGTITINGAKIQQFGTGNAGKNNQTGTIKMISGSIIISNDACALLNNDGKIIVSGGKIEQTGSGFGIRNYTIGTVEITGGEVISGSNYAIRNHSTALGLENPAVKVSGGLVKSTGSNAIITYDGTVYLTGGTIESSASNTTVFYSGTIADIPEGHSVINGTEQIAAGNEYGIPAGTYQTVTLEAKRVQ